MEKDVEESCTWKDMTQCEGCVNKGILHCRWKVGVPSQGCFIPTSGRLVKVKGQSLAA